MRSSCNSGVTLPCDALTLAPFHHGKWAVVSRAALGRTRCQVSYGSLHQCCRTCKGTRQHPAAPDRRAMTSSTGRCGEALFAGFRYLIAEPEPMKLFCPQEANRFTCGGDCISCVWCWVPSGDHHGAGRLAVRWRRVLHQHPLSARL